MVATLGSDMLEVTGTLCVALIVSWCSEEEGLQLSSCEIRCRYCLEFGE